MADRAPRRGAEQAAADGPRRPLQRLSAAGSAAAGRRPPSLLRSAAAAEDASNLSSSGDGETGSEGLRSLTLA